MKKVILVLAGIICCGVIAVISYLHYAPALGMVMPLKEVTTFSRPAHLVISFIPYKLVLMNVSNESGVSYRELPEPNQSTSKILSDYSFYPGAAIVVCPDGSRFYVCMADVLAEYDSIGSFLRPISITEFELGPGKHIFGKTTEASNDKIWLSVESLPRRDSKHFIIEWQPDKIPNTRQVGPQAFSWTIAPLREKVFVFGEKTGIFDLDTREFAPKSWNMYSSADFTQANGLLLSDDRPEDKYDRIAWVDLANGSEVDITWGGEAQWGPDGYIYFKRGSTQLWRCKPDEGKCEPVYLATRIAKGGDWGIGNELKFSHDRTFLAFFYRIPLSSGKEHRGLVLIDLKNGEYLELDSKDFSCLYPRMVTEHIAFINGEILMVEDAVENFWFIMDMAWLTTNDVKTNSVPTSGPVETK